MIDAKLVDSVPGTPASTPGMIVIYYLKNLPKSSGFLRAQKFGVLTLIS
jgi:hypothetical protein